MTDGDNKRNDTARNIDAPDVGAFYFEEAVELLINSGCKIGRVDFTLQPRQADRAAGLSGPCRDFAAEAARGNTSAAGFAPRRAYRVVRCQVRRGARGESRGVDGESRGADGENRVDGLSNADGVVGVPICDLLLAEAKAPPGAAPGLDGIGDFIANQKIRHAERLDNE